MFLKRNKGQGHDTAIGLDLGTSQIKAAVIQKRGARLALTAYAIRPWSSPAGKRGTEQRVANDLQQVMSALNVPERCVGATISCSSAMVCQTEVPRIPIHEIRGALKLNSSRYLRRDFSNYCLDVTELPDLAVDPKAKKQPKMTVLVGGADREEIAWYRDALEAAKIRPEVMELAAVSVVNAFRMSKAELCEKEMILILDIGARSTSINFLRQGQPIITRITHFGGLQLSEYVAQMLSVEPAVAEEEKVKMSEPVQALIKTALAPLAREVRSSIDFCERQHENRVTRAYTCGGSACSAKILEFLTESAGIQFQGWNPCESIDTTPCNGDAAKLGVVAPMLAAAVGAAIARLS